MKANLAKNQNGSLDEIVKCLKTVPKSRLHIVRDVVAALAEPAVAKRTKRKHDQTTRKTLLKTSFCGIWEQRSDISSGKCYARFLRQHLEDRDDRD